MRALVVAGLVFLFPSSLGARLLPLTAKEVGLMLRSGYSAEAVLGELKTRRFADTLDAAVEKNLVESGASAALVEALKSGRFSVSPDDAIRAQAEITAQTQRRAAQAAESQKFNTLYQHQLAKERALAAAQPPVVNTIYPLLKGDLVYWHNGSLARFDDTPLEKKKLYALYFSAHWCGPCRKFTPGLVEFYNRVAPQHPEFELIFVSSDRANFNMETYMKDTSMPWPAIDFAKVGGKGALTRYKGDAIPSLVVIDANGKVISDSVEGGKYVGPEKVMTALDAVLKNIGQVAQRQ